MKAFVGVWRWLKEILNRDPVAHYLTQASDLADLERRLREAQTGSLPFARSFRWR